MAETEGRTSQLNDGDAGQGGDSSQEREFYPLIAGAVAVGLASLFGPDQGTKDLYVVSAQVIPVLLLALALEARIFRAAGPRPDQPPIDPAAALAHIQDVKAAIDTAQSAVDARARNIVHFGEEIAGWQREVDRLKQLAADLPPEQVPNFDGIHQKIETARADQAGYQSDVRRWVLDIEDSRSVLAQHEKRIKRTRRWWRMARISWWSNRVAYVGTGVLVLAIGEFESLLRIANGDYESRPLFAFAAIAYGFVAILVAALSER